MSLDLFSMMPKWHSLAHDAHVRRYFDAIHMHYMTWDDFEALRPWTPHGTTYLDYLPFGPGGNNLTIDYRPSELLS